MFSSFVTSIQHWFRGFRQGLSRKLIKIGVVPPPVEENAHLTEEQREMLQKLNFLTLRRPGVEERVYKNHGEMWELAYAF